MLDLKNVAINMNVPVILLTNLPKSDGRRTDDGPCLSDLPDAVVNTADSVLFLNQEYLTIARNLRGPIGSIAVTELLRDDKSLDL